MNPRRAAAVTHCPNCGLRIVPTPKEFKRWRLDARLNQREMGKRIRVSASYIAYLESGKRSPSATVIARYWKFIPN
jgi:predicted transcriptional regulator